MNKINLAAKRREIEKELDNAAIHYSVELNMMLADMLNEIKPKGRYLDWSLNDCHNMQKFYQLILDKQFKKAFGKLNFLGKECSLVPHKIWHLLDKLDDL